MRVTVREIAKDINLQCQSFRYYSAIGLIQETLPLWKQKTNQHLLCEEAQSFVVHYLKLLK